MKYRVKLQEPSGDLVTYLGIEEAVDIITWNQRVFQYSGVDTHPEDPRKTIPLYTETTHYQAPPSPPEMRFG